MHGKIALSLFAFVAVFGMLLVQVADPSAGAVASPYYQGGAAVLSERAVQLLEAETDVEYEIATTARDNYTVTDKPKPPPPPPPAPEPSTKSSGGSSNYAVPAAVADPGSAKAV